MIGSQPRIPILALRAPRVPGGLVAAGAAFAGAVVVAWIVVARPDLYRFLFAVVLAANLLIVAMRWPRAAAVLTLLFLPFLALVRRLLIADAGWSSYDPLLFVGPLVACALIVRFGVFERRRFERDTFSTLVYLLLALALVQSLNPTGPGLVAGLSGLLFVAAPLLWFVIGREMVDRRTVWFLICAVIPLALATSAYGLWQTEIDMPSWDATWAEVNGYAALHVGEEIRSFGTFSSSSEYAAFAGVGFVFACALLFHRRPVPAFALPLLAVAVFLASARGYLALTVFAVVVFIALRARDGRSAVRVGAAGLSLVIAGSLLLGPALDRAAGRSSNPLVSHQVQGLLHPLDPEQSTLPIHWENFKNGVTAGFSHPIGRGTGMNTNAAGKVGAGGGAGTDVDLSDNFVSLGLVGGILFAVILVGTFRRVISLYMSQRDPVILAIAGLLVVTVGQWMNGGHYALAPLTWLLIGWTARQYAHHAAQVPPGV